MDNKTSNIRKKVLITWWLGYIWSHTAVIFWQADYDIVIVDNDFNKFKNLKKFVDYETKGSRAVQEIPPHVKLMQRMEIADYEEGSDSGNIRYYPNGRLIKSLLEDYVSKKIGDYGAVEVETPIMYDLEHPTLKKYLHKFPARQ